MLGEPFGLVDLPRAHQRLGQLALRLHQVAALLGRAEPADRLAQQLLGPDEVAAVELDPADPRQRPARATGRADLLERGERFAQERRRPVVITRRGRARAGDALRPAERLAAAALGGELERAPAQLPRLRELRLDVRD